MTKKQELTEDDIKALKEAFKGAKPLKHTKITPEKQKVTLKSKKKRHILDEEEPISHELSDFSNLDEVSADEHISYSTEGLQHKTLRKLRLGQYNTEAVLDLHGSTIENARTSLSRFLTNCQNEGIRYALIIHGKGRGNSKPILKNNLNNWLRQTNGVIAFCSAKPKDGGSGAVYVILRRERIGK